MISSFNQSLFTLTFDSCSNNKRRKDAFSKKLKNFQGKWMSILGSCHGLVLVNNFNDCQFLTNPTTLEFVKVPNFSLPFYPSTYGFGFDSSSNDYKIVKIEHHDQPGSREIFVGVYSLKMKTWRTTKNSPNGNIIPDTRAQPGVYLNGDINWLPTDNGFLNSIVSFNLSSETFKQVPAPSSFDKFKFQFSKLFVLGGCLAMVCDRFYSDSEFYDHIDIWVMKRYGVQESWTKFSVDIPEDTDWFSPICQLGDEDVVLLKDDEQLVLHNYKEEASRNVTVARMHNVFCDEIMDFSESLVSPNFSSWDEVEKS